MKDVMMTERNETKTTNETPAPRRAGRSVWAALSAHKTAVGMVAFLLGSGLAASVAQAGNDNRAPEVPGDIAVQAGNKVHFHGFGVGVQIYTWDGSAWTGPVPEATLYDADGNVVATHFAGPTWQSNSGSKVVGAVVPPRVTVDPDAIPWLLLAAVTPEGPGIFADTSFI